MFFYTPTPSSPFYRFRPAFINATLNDLLSLNGTAEAVDGKTSKKKMFFVVKFWTWAEQNFVFLENGSFAPLPLAYCARCCNRSDARAWGYKCVCASEHSTASAMS
jgi:hypothetical protein